MSVVTSLLTGVCNEVGGKGFINRGAGEEVKVEQLLKVVKIQLNLGNSLDIYYCLDITFNPSSSSSSSPSIFARHD